MNRNQHVLTAGHRSPRRRTALPAPLLAFVVAGCGGSPLSPAVEPVPPDGPGDGSPCDSDSACPTGQLCETTCRSACPDKTLLPVYFDEDQSQPREDQSGALAANAHCLRAWREGSVEVVGHVDARGTEEYDLQLASRMAEGVARALAALGVPGARLRTTSRGEAEPVCEDSTPECWARNRRVELIWSVDAGVPPPTPDENVPPPAPEPLAQEPAPGAVVPAPAPADDPAASGSVPLGLLPSGGAGRLDHSVLRQALGGIREVVTRCFSDALERDEEFSCVGQFLVSVGISGDVTVEPDFLADACPRRLVRCLAGALESLDFTATPPTGGDVLFRAPVQIQPLL